MSWWIWMLFGLVLLALEMAAAGSFYLLFFGLGALIVGALTGLGVVPSPWVQWALFSILSAALIALLRKPLRDRTRVPQDAIDAMIGEVAITAGPIEAGGAGKAELRGTQWSAHNAGSSALAAGARCRVEKVEGLTIWLVPEERN